MRLVVATLKMFIRESKSCLTLFDDVILSEEHCVRNPTTISGYKIPLIENLGTTLDQFDTIDFSDNEIRKVDNIPYLPRIKTLLFNNNRIWWVFLLKVSPAWIGIAEIGSVGDDTGHTDTVCWL